MEVVDWAEAIEARHLDLGRFSFIEDVKLAVDAFHHGFEIEMVLAEYRKNV